MTDPREPPSAPRVLEKDDPWLLGRIRESIQSGLAVLDSNHRIISFNRAAEKITGFDRSEVQGQPLVEALGEANRETQLDLAW